MHMQDLGSELAHDALDVDHLPDEVRRVEVEPNVVAGQ